MSNAKQVKAIDPLIKGLPSTATFKSGDGVSLFSLSHTTVSGPNVQRLDTLTTKNNETSHSSMTSKKLVGNITFHALAQ